MKTYIKDLTPEEIIKRLKNGEIIKFDCDNTFHIKMIDGIICRIYENYFIINGGFDNDGFYFETEEPLTFEQGKFYKTRDGKKAFVSFIAGDGRKYPVSGIICGEALTSAWETNGRIITDNQSDQDIISKWED